MKFSSFPLMRVSKIIYPKFLKVASWFTNLETGGCSLNARVIEYSFVILKLEKQKKGKVLDVGCTSGNNIVPFMLTLLGWEVYGMDVRRLKFKHPNFHFVQGDIRKTTFPDDFFDCVCAISTLEHIGLKGRYSVTEEDLEGDIKAVNEIKRILRPEGHFLITLPYGKGRLIKPLHRIYDKVKLQKLFSSWKIEGGDYLIHNSSGYWINVSEEEAGKKDYLKGERALALLELTIRK